MAFEHEKVDRRADEFGFGGAEREIGQIGRELFGKHAAKHRSRSLHGRLLGFGKFVRCRLFSHEPADLIHQVQGDDDEED